MAIQIYTDGSSRNGRTPAICTAGWAMAAMFSGEFGGKLFIRYGSLPAPSSNNVGEIMGVLFAMQMFHKSDIELEFFSDSQYVVKSINEWRFRHARNNYESIANADLLVPLYGMWDTHQKSKISWVRGHAGNAMNEVADKWCGMGADRNIVNKSDANSDIKFVEPEECYLLYK